MKKEAGRWKHYMNQQRLRCVQEVDYIGTLQIIHTGQWVVGKGQWAFLPWTVIMKTSNCGCGLVANGKIQWREIARFSDFHVISENTDSH